MVSDFDGTITEKDFYLLIAEKYMGPNAMAIWDEYRAGRLTHIEAMQSFFSHAPSNELELASMLQQTGLDPKFRESVEMLQAAEWDLIIVSAGSSWYIDRLLASAGVEAPVHSNPGVIESGRGLVLQSNRGSRFYSEDVGVDKSAVVRDALQNYERVAFAGDGPPDLPPALLVDPDLRFARGFLAEELQRLGQSFRSFRHWSEVAMACAGVLQRE